MTLPGALTIVTVPLAPIHLAAARLRFPEGMLRSVWLSSTSVIPVVYVFLHLLPELAMIILIALLSGGVVLNVLKKGSRGSGKAALALSRWAAVFMLSCF